MVNFTASGQILQASFAVSLLPWAAPHFFVQDTVDGMNSTENLLLDVFSAITVEPTKNAFAINRRWPQILTVKAAPGQGNNS